MLLVDVYSNNNFLLNKTSPPFDNLQLNGTIEGKTVSVRLVGAEFTIVFLYTVFVEREASSTPFLCLTINIESMKSSISLTNFLFRIQQLAVLNLSGINALNY